MQLWATDCRWDPAQVWRVVTLPPCRMERATLLGVMQQQIVAVQCPLLQGLPVQISLLISPVWMMAVKVSNEDCRMMKGWWQICVYLCFGIDTGPQSSWHSLIALPMIRCSNFDVSPEIRCLGVSGRYCRHGRGSIFCNPTQSNPWLYRPNPTQHRTATQCSSNRLRKSETYKYRVSKTQRLTVVVGRIHYVNCDDKSQWVIYAYAVSALLL